MRKNKTVLLYLIFFVLLLLMIPNFCMAKDLDQINEYNITVDPRTNGSLDILYNIKWQVLDSDSEGPLEWVKIGIPNSSVDSIKAVTKNIKSARYYSDSGDYVRIDFKQKYYKDEIIEFSFSIHQNYMYKLENDKCIFEFTPGWFNDLEVKKINIFWNAKNVSSSSSKMTNSDNYLTWSSSLKKGKKLTANVTYLKNNFNLDYSKQSQDAPKEENLNLTDFSTGYYFNLIKILVVAIIIVYMLSFFLGIGYYSHRGFGYGNRGYYDSHYHRRSSSLWDSNREDRGYSSHSSHSSCVSSCACACACAGGGRAGCSKKDFYGTNLNIENIKKVLK